MTLRIVAMLTTCLMVGCSSAPRDDGDAKQAILDGAVWEPFSTERFLTARHDNKVIVVHANARWILSYWKMEQILADPEVTASLKAVHVTPFLVDLSNDAHAFENCKDALAKEGVTIDGAPWLVVMTQSGDV